MKIYSWNVNGIRAVAKKGVLTPFLAEHNPDIFCIQETKAHAKQFDEAFDAYETYWHEAEKKGYAGTAIFTKHTPEDVRYGLPEDLKKQYTLADSYGDTTEEGRVTTIELASCFVVSVYTPNAKEDLSRLPVRMEWDKAFLAYMNELNAEKPVIFCGDLNVAHTEDDLARPKDNKGKKGFTDEERSGIDAMEAAGFVDSFREFKDGNGYYTWWSHFANARERNVGWRIDYIMIAESLRPVLKSAHIHPDVMGSDHCPTSVVVEIPTADEL